MDTKALDWHLYPGRRAYLTHTDRLVVLICNDLCCAIRIREATSRHELGVATAQHWSAVTGPLFAKAGYHQHVDPLDRIFGYIDFRAAIAKRAARGVHLITPKAMIEAMAKGGEAAKQVFAALMSMKKIDIAAIEAAMHADA